MRLCHASSLSISSGVKSSVDVSMPDRITSLPVAQPSGHLNVPDARWSSHANKYGPHASAAAFMVGPEVNQAKLIASTTCGLLSPACREVTIWYRQLSPLPTA